MSPQREFSRRRFLTRLAFVVGAPLVVRCGGTSGPPAVDVATQARAFDQDLDCTDSKGLWPAEVATRTDNEYVDRAGDPGQFCFVCNNYRKPKVAGSCATCTTVKGPINPLGGCKTWTKKLG